MPLSEVFSCFTQCFRTTSEPAEPPRAASQTGQVHRSESARSGSHRVAAGGQSVHSSLAYERSKSQEDLDLEPTVIYESMSTPVPEDLQRRIAQGEASLRAILQRTGSGKAEEGEAERLTALQLADAAGEQRLVALEAMALEQVAKLVKSQLTPLTNAVNYSVQSNGELSLMVDSLPTQEQEEVWEDYYHALDEAILRLVGTTGSAQTFNYGKRVAGLGGLVLKASLKDEGWKPSASTDSVGIYREQATTARAKEILPFLMKHREFENTQRSWLLRAAKLEEVILEALGFNPMTRSVVVLSELSD